MLHGSFTANNSLLQIYRCWVVYPKSHRLAVVGLPLIFWLSAFACSILLVYFYAAFVAATASSGGVVSARVVPHARLIWTGFYCCDIIINIYTTCRPIVYSFLAQELISPITGALIYQIMRSTSGEGHMSRRLYRTCKVLAQFALLYTATSIFGFIALLLDIDPKYDAMRFTVDAVVSCPTSMYLSRLHEMTLPLLRTLLSRASCSISFRYAYTRNELKQSTIRSNGKGLGSHCHFVPRLLLVRIGISSQAK